MAKTHRVSFMMVFVMLCIEFVGQQTFSRRVPIISTSVFHSVYVEEDGYLITATTLDTLGVDHFDFATALFDVNGDLISFQNFGDTSNMTFSQMHSNSYIEDYYIQQAIGNRNDTAAAVYHWFNTEGDTIRSRFLRSPYLPNGETGASFISPTYSLILPDSTVYIAATIAKPVTWNDVCIWKLDADGNELWHYIYATEGDPESCRALLPTNDGIVAAIFSRDDPDYSLPATNLVYISNDGSFVNEVEGSTWNDHFTSIRAMHRVEQNQIICAGEMNDVNETIGKAYLFRINENGTLIWECVVGDYPNVFGGNNSFSNVVTTTDNNAIASGLYMENINDTLQSFVRLVKLNAINGEIIWLRDYQIIENSDAIQQAYDLKATPDGGVVFCGEATDYDQENVSLENPIQQGWICKLDACGCLVPGCDENCIVGVNEHEETTTSGFLVGPNPASDFLNIYLKPQTSLQSNVRFELRTTDGKLVKQFSAGKADTTYLLDVSDLASGNYLLTLIHDGQVKEVKRVVVE
ncbi:MAG: T9SS type A sorting domain-containing protein [Flavobacteriales bacterium]|nr:T9SS type A sorting domain-containing protein [Flavobacteriales bacterium]